MGKNRLVVWIRLYAGMVLVSILLTLKVVAQKDRQRSYPDSLQVRELAPVLIKSRLPVAVRKGDTVVYDAARYRTAATFRLSALLNQVPGFRVDENGRIHYNGKEISRIMIDGDDLTGDRYYLLSAQLRADLIGKIQLIEKHQQNRLLRGIQPSDQLAVNLVTDRKFWNRPTGSMGLMAGGRQQYRSEADAVVLSKSWKSLLFGLLSNTSLNHNPAGFADEGGKTAAYASFPQLEKRAVNPEFLPPQYQIISADHRIKWIMSKPFGSANKIRIITEAGNSKESISANEVRIFMLDDSSNYQNWQSGTFSSSGRKGTMEIIHDAQGSRTARYSLLVGHQHNRSEQLNRQTGMLPGILQQLQFPHRFSWQLSQEEYFQLKRGVLLWEASYSTDQHRDLLIAMGTPVLQRFKHHGNLYQFHLGRVIKEGKAQFAGGIRATSEKIRSHLNINHVATHVVKYYPYLSWNYQHNRKWRHLLQLSAGTAGLSLEKRMSWYGIYHAEVRTNWQPKAGKQYFFSVQAIQKPREGNTLFAGPLYRFPGTWWRSPNSFAVPRTWLGQLGLVRMNLYSGLMLNIMLQGTLTRFDQGMFLTLNNFNQVYAAFQLESQTQWLVNMNIEKYLHAVSIRYTCQFNYNVLNQPQRFNTLTYAGNIRNIHQEHRISTHWKTPYNMVLQYTIRKSRYSSIYSRPAGSLRIEQYLRVQSAYRLGKRGIMQFDYLIAEQSGSFFKSCDFLMNINITSRWKISLQAMNLFNTRQYITFGIDAVSTSRHERLLMGRTSLIGFQYGF